ncbi:hypothetical protein CNR22_19040 [Sphingobacteriaceae bacterium]|nr:hypothetical protein CNR22_19040 [Sphingobacteriaceae bacterium]
MDPKTKQNINIGIISLCVIAFIPVFKADFVNYDDPEYVLNNPYIKQFSLQNIIAIFKGKASLLYVPLTHLSYLLQSLLFGEKPFAFHFINLVLHILNALLLFKILQALKVKDLFITCFILLFFSISPLVSESVAWITERKDVLYCLFYFLSALRFLDFLQSSKRKDLGLSFLFFILACFSKPMAVTLPALMLVYILFIYGKGHKPYSLKLLPFFLAAVLFSLLTFYSVSGGKNLNENNLHYGVLEKIVIAFAAIGFYFFKPFMPWNQQVIYLFPSPEHLMESAGLLLYAVSAVVLLAVFLYSLLKTQNKVIHTLFICWLILVIPLLQLDDNNHSYVNERYFYISIIFPAAVVFVWLQRFKLNPAQVKNGLIVLTILFTILTFKRSLAWKNTLTLFTQELKSEAGDPYALNNLGFYYNSSNNFQKGRESLLEAMHIKPNDPIFLNNYGWSLSELREPDSAMYFFKKALTIDKDYIPALNNLGLMYSKKMKIDTAGILFNHAYALDPNNGETNFYMGAYMEYLGMRQQATGFYERARQLGNKSAIGK